MAAHLRDTAWLTVTQQHIDDSARLIQRLRASLITAEVRLADAEAKLAESTAALLRIGGLTRVPRPAPVVAVAGSTPRHDPAPTFDGSAQPFSGSTSGAGTKAR